MKILRWILFVVAALAMVACGIPAMQADTVARVNDVTLSQQELDARVKRVQDGFAKQPTSAQNGAAPTADQIQRSMVTLFVQQNLVLSLAKQRNISVGDTEINSEIERVRGQVEQSGQKLDTVVQEQLGLPGVESSEFRQFMSYLLAQDKLGATLVTTDTVRQEIEPMVKAEAAKKVKEYHSAHILFMAGNPQQGGPPPTDAEYAAALEKANKAEERLANGEDFATLAKELSDDPGSKEKGGEYDWMPQGSFVPEYEKAIFEDLKPGEYTKTPVKSSYGYHIIKLLEPIREGPAIPPEQVAQVIDQQVQQQLPQKQQQALQDLVDQEKQKAKDEGRLVEPAYAEATATPAQPDGTTQPAPTAQP
ncbi:MAG TPA: peptidylprolyl isomerase [Roseiflexaceae bacterium]|nr:peptidylprolyl isomerase [Roseiflexaceae bacterium]